jgi:hypothetical protein
MKTKEDKDLDGLLHLLATIAFESIQRKDAVLAEEAQKKRAREWLPNWIEGVASGTSTSRTTERLLSHVEQYGGLDAAKALAVANGVHLLLIEGDTDTLVLARLKPFVVVC